MQQHHRQAVARVTESQPARRPKGIHRSYSRTGYATGYGIVSSGIPIHAATYATPIKPARKEESDHRENADHGNVPSIGLRQRQANAANLASHMRPDQRPSGHGLRHRRSSPATRAKARARMQSVTALLTKDCHNQSLRETAPTASIIRILIPASSNAPELLVTRPSPLVPNPVFCSLFPFPNPGLLGPSFPVGSPATGLCRWGGWSLF